MKITNLKTFFFFVCFLFSLTASSSLYNCPSNQCTTDSGNLLKPTIMLSLGSNPRIYGVIQIDLTQSPNNISCVTDDLVQNGYKPANYTAPCTIGAGNFSIYVTDSNHTTLDSTGGSTISPTNNGSLVSSPGTSPTSTNYVPYVGGLQYVNGYYCRGATYTCLSGYQPAKNAIVIANTVATTVSSSSSTDAPCSPSASGQINTSSTTIETSPDSCVPSDGTVMYTVSNKLSDRQIPLYNSQASSQVLDPSTYYNPSEQIVSTQSSVTSTNTYIGSQDPSNGQYYVNSYCTGSTSYSCAPQSTCTVSLSNPCPAVCTCYTTTSTSTSSASQCSISGCDTVFMQNSSSEVSTPTGYSGSNGTLQAGTSSTSADGSTIVTPTYGQRPANPMELGLCLPLPQPQCTAINYTSANDSGAQNDGYANWPATEVLATATGTCAAGATPNTNGRAPTRVCSYVDDGTVNSTTGCPNYTINFGGVSNPCTKSIPSWWPSNFLANTSFQGAIFNQFNVSINYLISEKFIPLYSNYNPISYSNNSLAMDKPERWWNSGYDGQNCNSYGQSYTLGNTQRNNGDGDQEMLYLTATQWTTLWQSYDLSWLLAENNPSNMPTGQIYTNYDGCYIYDVTNNISARISGGLTIGMKICKMADKVSFSLVDTTQQNPYTAYIMQSNILDYYGNGGNDDTSLAWSNGSSGTIRSSNYLNHGIVILRGGFADNNITVGQPPENLKIYPSTESISLTYAFQSNVNAYNTGSSGIHHNHSQTNNVISYIDGSGTLSCSYSSDSGAPSSCPNYPNLQPSSNSTTPGCALSVYRNAIDYSRNTSISSYIPLYSGQSHGDKVNFSLYENSSPADNFNNENCNLTITINSYTEGNSANNPNMFLWSSPTSYSPCNN